MSCSTPPSVSVTIAPQDSRCRYWAKIIRCDEKLPDPKSVDGASTITGNYLRQGDEELLAGDMLFEGEANHHRRDRGWSYHVQFLDSNTGELVRIRPDSTIKAALKAAGLHPLLLLGSGDLAACVRIAHAARLGIGPWRSNPTHSSATAEPLNRFEVL
jgi:hypothetical protein